MPISVEKRKKGKKEADVKKFISDRNKVEAETTLSLPQYKDHSVHVEEAENGHVVNINRFGRGHKRYVATSKAHLKKILKRHSGY